MRLTASMTELARIVGSNVRSARKHLKLTQRDLSARTEMIGFRIDRRVIGKIECGEKCVTAYDLIVLSQALHLPVDEILKGEYAHDESPADHGPVGK